MQLVLTDFFKQEQQIICWENILKKKACVTDLSLILPQEKYDATARKYDALKEEKVTSPQYLKFLVRRV